MVKAKDATLTIKLEQELRDAFVQETEIDDRPASQVVRELMRAYIERRRRERSGKDATGGSEAGHYASV
jgi:metal-responsive CopG/Arc/MetJ family transcriptional regulator